MNNSIRCSINQRFAQLIKIGQTFLLSGFAVVTISFSSFAQTVIFDEFPISAQIYQRDDHNAAVVGIKGRFYTQGYTDISIIVKKDGKDFNRQSQKLIFQGGGQDYAQFSFQPSISTGLIEYGFYVYAHHGNNDSTLIKEASQVLCGDNIIIYGQSNAEANDGTQMEKFKDEFKFGRTTFADFQTGDYLWFPTMKWNYYLSGMIGLEIQRQLIDKYKIPIGIINGAVGNMSIDELMNRNEQNHEDIQYYYGQMLRKANRVGIAKTARIIIWRQGESEAFEARRAALYPEKFTKLRNQLLEDYPSVKKIYVYQNNALGSANDKAGDLRDFQRRVGDLYPDCTAISTVGTPGYDGLHYSYEGYMLNAQEAARLIAKDFMNSTDTKEIHSPNIRKAYFTDNNNALVLEFEPDQQMVYPDYGTNKNNGSIAYIKDYIYLDGQTGNVSGGRSEGNKVILQLNQRSEAKFVSYYPDSFTFDIESLSGIPNITNSRGYRALTFKNVVIGGGGDPIVNPPAKPSLNARWEENSLRRITLEWQLVENRVFDLEKSVGAPHNFVKITSMAQGPYHDLKVKRGITYYYRLNYNNEMFSDITEVAVPLDNTFNYANENLLQVYPNPVSKGAEVLIDLQVSAQELILSNNQGNIIRRISVNADERVSVNTEGLIPGVYLVKAISDGQQKIIKKIIVD